MRTFEEDAWELCVAVRDLLRIADSDRNIEAVERQVVNALVQVEANIAAP